MYQLLRELILSLPLYGPTLAIRQVPLGFLNNGLIIREMHD